MGREAGSCGWEPLSKKCLQGTAEPGESFGPSIKEVNGEQSTKSTLQKGRDFCKPRAEGSSKGIWGEIQVPAPYQVTQRQ
jgi:hypothetical protein